MTIEHVKEINHTPPNPVLEPTTRAVIEFYQRIGYPVHEVVSLARD